MEIRSSVNTNTYNYLDCPQLISDPLEESRTHREGTSRERRQLSSSQRTEARTRKLPVKSMRNQKRNIKKISA